MRTKGHQVYTILINIHWNFSDSLRSIAEEQYTMLAGYGTYFANRLDSADLIIGIHDRYQYGSRLNSCFQFLQINCSVWFYGKISHLSAHLFQMLASVQHCFMLCSGSNDMIAFAGVHIENTFDR